MLKIEPRDPVMPCRRQIVDMLQDGAAPRESLVEKVLDRLAAGDAERVR